MTARLAILLFGAWLMLGQAIAAAQSATPTASSERKAQAEKLFDEARQLMTQPERLDEACETFEKSYALMERGDTLMNLAECHRRQGKTATAWREFDKAIRHAEDVAYAEAIEVAKQLRDQLGAALSKLIVEVPAETAALKMLSVRLDAQPLEPSQWGKPVALDPGRHVVTANAADRVPFHTAVELDAEADSQRVVVVFAPLAAAAAPEPRPAPHPPEPAPQSADGGLPTWTWIVGGSGLVALAGSVVYGLHSSQAGDRLDEHCGAERTTCPADYDFDGDRDTETRSFGLFVGLGAAGLAAVAVAAGGMIWDRADRGAEAAAAVPRWTAVPQIAAEGGGLSLRAAF